MIKRKKILIIIALFIYCFLHSENIFVSNLKTFLITKDNTIIQYDDLSTIPLSESIFVNDSLLVQGRDYSIDYTKSTISFQSQIYDQTAKIYYSTYKEDEKKRLFLYRILPVSDSLKVDKPKKDLFDLWSDNSKISVKGSKTISVSIGNKDDLSINQSMDLKINGEISENVNIDAQLNDSQSPITPEGNTRELSNLDQIYFRLYGKQYELAFGDLEIQYDNTKFINYLNKFEGVKAHYFNKNKVQTAIALSKSTSAEIEFYGVDGKQGPYYLRPSGAYTNVKIISGTEIIYLDSQLMQRGEDYFIDYDEGTINFQINHIISVQNRIKANFQYSDENYRKNLYLFENTVQITEKLSLSTHNIFSLDDKKNPLSYTLTNKEINILKNSGDQPVYISGVEMAGSGLGRYKKITTEDTEYYVYAPDDSLAEYNVSFSYTGLNQGDCIPVSINIYEYLGPYLGSYMPIVQISAPEYKANMDFRLDYDKDIYHINYEILFSDNDKNTYSSLDSSDDHSYIHEAELILKPENEVFNPELSFIFKEKKKYLYTFTDISMTNDNQFYYFTAPDSLNSSSYSNTLKFGVYQYMKNNFYLNLINHEGFDKQIRMINDFNMNQQKLLPEFKYKLIRGQQILKNKDQLKTTNHNLFSAYQYKLIKLMFLNDLLENQTIMNDSISNAYKTNSNKIEIKFGEFKFTNIGLSYQKEMRYEWKEKYELSYTSNMYGFNGVVSKSINTNSVQYARKNIDYQYNASNQHYDFAEFRGNNSFMNSLIQSYINYSISNMEFYPKIRELQYVGSSQGMYDSTGVWDENGEYDWVYVQSGVPEQTIDLKADFNTIISFNKLRNDTYLKKFQFDSWYYVYESTKEPDKYQVYLLNQAFLMKDSVTVYGKQVIKETLWYNYLPNKLVFKYTANHEKSLDNRYQTEVKSTLFTHEWTVLLTRFVSSDWEYSFIISDESDSRYSLKTESKQNHLTMRYNIQNSLIFNTNVQMNIEQNKNENYSWTNLQRNISEDVMFFWGDRYRINTKMEITDNKSNYSTSLYLPEGKRKGTILKWNNNIYYRFNQYTQLSFEYSGNDYPQRETVHQIRIEIKAEF